VARLFRIEALNRVCSKSASAGSFEFFLSICKALLLIVITQKSMRNWRLACRTSAGQGRVVLEHVPEANPASSSLSGGDGGSMRAWENNARRFAPIRSQRQIFVERARIR
jgi:hypothetical protein